MNSINVLPRPNASTLQPQIDATYRAAVIILRPDFQRAVGPERNKTRKTVPVTLPLNVQGIPVFAHASNHYAGFAPATVELFQELR